MPLLTFIINLAPKPQDQNRYHSGNKLPDEQLLSNQEYKWINKTDIAAYAMPTPIRKLLERYV